MNDYTITTTNKPLYRTIKECHEELLRRDKYCKISMGYIRTLCRQGKVEYIANGSKSIVNLNHLLAYFGFSDTQAEHKETPPMTTGKSNARHIVLGEIKCESLIPTGDFRLWINQ